MSALNNFGQAILEYDDGVGGTTSGGGEIVSSITSAISNNIGEVLTVFGFMIGVYLVLSLLRRSTRGSV